MLFKKCQVVMLPTNEKSNIWLRNGKLELNSSASNKINPQHLYILSDEEIKEGDWFITPSGHLHKFDYENEMFMSDEERNTSKKIIATTDKFLTYLYSFGAATYHNESYPQLSQQFIEKFIEEYNKGNIITKVMVEYLSYEDGDESTRMQYLLNKPLKINSKDNTITIRKIKNSWNREEHKSDIKRLILLEREYRERTSHFIDTEDLNKWIEDNL